MRRKTLALLIAGLMALAPAIAAAKAKAAKPTPKPPAAKTEPSKPAPAQAEPAKAPPSPVANFDARNPQSVVALLNASGGKAVQAQKEEGSVLVEFTSPAANFSLQFADCDAQGRGCKAVQFDSIVQQTGPSFAQMNAFNQSSVMCRGYEDKAGKPHVIYSTLLFADEPYDHFRTQMLAWTGCIAEFRSFLKDPNGYLATAP